MPDVYEEIEPSGTNHVRTVLIRSVCHLFAVCIYIVYDPINSVKCHGLSHDLLFNIRRLGEAVQSVLLKLIYVIKLLQVEYMKPCRV